MYIHVHISLSNIAEEYFNSSKVKIQIHSYIPNRFPLEPWGSRHPSVNIASIAIPVLPSNGTSVTQKPKVPL